MPDRRGHRSGTAKRALAAGCVVAAGTGIGVGIWQAGASGAPGLRLAAATTTSVSRTLDVTGTLEPANQSQAAFQVAGTVTSVEVTQGQKVNAGQTLAKLDPTLLQSQVNTAQAELTAAQAKLAADESGQAATSNAASAGTAAAVVGAQAIILTSTGPAPTGSGPANGSGRSGGSAPGTLAADQQAVVTAQHTADMDLQAATAALAQVGSACGAAPGGGSPPTGQTTTTTAPTTTTTTAPTTTTTAPTTTTTTSTPGTTTTSNPGSGTTTTTGPAPGKPSAGSGACTSALSVAGSAEQRVATDQATLASAEAALAQLLSSEASGSGSAAGSPGAGTHKSGPAAPSAGGSSSSGLSGGSRASGSSAASQPTDTPAQLASDQATIDSDEASLTSMEQSLSAAVLTSPISGTVASVGITAGQTVAAGSSTAVITVISANGYVSTTSLTTSQVQQVKVGDQAQLTVDGVRSALSGVVSAIDPVDVSSSTYTYPVTIAVTSFPEGMAVGSTTRIRIDVQGADHALAVPTSAVHTTGTGASFVYVEQAGKMATQRVTVGVVGPVYTQIDSGLKRGQSVVLADPSQAVPASSTNQTTRGPGAGLGRFLRGAAAGGGAGALRTVLRGQGG